MYAHRGGKSYLVIALKRLWEGVVDDKADVMLVDALWEAQCHSQKRFTKDKDLLQIFKHTF